MDANEVSINFGDPNSPGTFHIDIASLAYDKAIRLWISGRSNYFEAGPNRIATYSTTQFCAYLDGEKARKLARAILAATDEACGPELPKPVLTTEQAVTFADVEVA